VSDDIKAERISSVSHRLQEQRQRISKAWDEALGAEWRAEIWRRMYLGLGIAAAILGILWIVGVKQGWTGPAALSCFAVFGIAVGVNRFNRHKSGGLSEESHFWRRWTEDASEYLAWLKQKSEDDLDDARWNLLRDRYEEGAEDVRRALNEANEQLQETVRAQAEQAVSLVRNSYKGLSVRELRKKSEAKATASEAKAMASDEAR